jgi:hypothetical protein
MCCNDEVGVQFPQYRIVADETPSPRRWVTEICTDLAAEWRECTPGECGTPGYFAAWDAHKRVHPPTELST